VSFLAKLSQFTPSERALVELRPLKDEHVPDLQRAASDGELWNLNVTSVPRPEHCLTYVRAAREIHEYGPQLAYAVFDRKTQSIVGTTRYYGIKEAPRRVYIGYTWYRASAQQTHINTASKLELLQQAFEVADAQVVAWETDCTNFRSQAAIERLGAQKDGILRSHLVRRDGTMRDTVVYSMLAREWPQAKARLQERLARHSG
jgi:RimJ/RimL family protein N-acetyltransferase